jgi:hypothetical protein
MTFVGFELREGKIPPNCRKVLKRWGAVGNYLWLPYPVFVDISQNSPLRKQHVLKRNFS